MNCLKTIFTTITLFCVTYVYTQNLSVDIQHLTPKDGLANLYTTTIYQNKQGFVWISTKYGLNRYDGYNFKLYTKEKNGLYLNSKVSQITQGDGDNLWLSYHFDETETQFYNDIQHIDVFDVKTEKTYDFETYFDEPLPFTIQSVLSLKVNDSKKRPWIVTKKGAIFLFDNNRFVRKFKLENQLISGLTVDKNDNFYIAFGNTVMKVDKNGTVQYKKTFEQEIRNVWIDDKGLIWVEAIEIKNNLEHISLLSISPRQEVKTFYTFEKELNPEPYKILNIYRTTEGKWLISDYSKKN
ncbi:MAG: hypothetical protein AB8G11_25735 [Saprospiraceae bacterium]